MIKPKKHGLDIFKTLKAIDQRDMGYYDSLTEEEKKGFHPTVVMRWLSDATSPMDEYFIRATNERLNRHLYDIADHPELQYRLAASCGLGMSARHQWIAGKNGRTKDLVFDFFQDLYPDLNNIEIDIVIGQIRGKKDFEEFVNGTGADQETVKKLVRAYTERQV